VEVLCKDHRSFITNQIIVSVVQGSSFFTWGTGHLMREMVTLFLAVVAIDTLLGNFYLSSGRALHISS